MTYRKDGLLSAAINKRYTQLCPAEQAVIDDCTRVIIEDFKARGLGRAAALEILYRIGRLMNEQETRR